ALDCSGMTGLQLQHALISEQGVAAGGGGDATIIHLSLGLGEQLLDFLLRARGSRFLAGGVGHGVGGFRRVVRRGGIWIVGGFGGGQRGGGGFSRIGRLRGRGACRRERFGSRGRDRNCRSGRGPISGGAAGLINHRR
ncbi:hypothetical protein RZS08_20550, partial [Arthrospira platensis SPKY1]|nr:hypothetical protein [Arthrospira platensis SPKY1]